MDERTRREVDPRLNTPNTVEPQFNDREVDRYVNYYQKHLHSNSPNKTPEVTQTTNPSTLERQLNAVLKLQQQQQRQLEELKRQQIQLQNSSINQSLNVTNSSKSPVKVSMDSSNVSMRMSLNDMRSEERENILKMLASASKTDLLFTKGNSGEIQVTYKLGSDVHSEKSSTKPSPADMLKSLSMSSSKDSKNASVNASQNLSATSGNVRTIDWLLRIIDDIYNNRYSVRKLFNLTVKVLLARDNISRRNFRNIFFFCIQPFIEKVWIRSNSQTSYS